MQSLQSELKQQPERVAIGADRVRTRLLLLHETLSEEALQQRRKTGGWLHSASSQRPSRRSTARPISSGQALRYQ
jgi:hypothetical protein